MEGGSATETVCDGKPGLHHIATLPAREAACGDLSPGQIASRTQYIVTAARAGVHGALMNLVSIEGPNGMLHSFSKDDPEGAQIEHDAVEASLATADPGALLAAGANRHLRGKGRCQLQAESKKLFGIGSASETARAIDEGKLPPK